jgi:hypothetical protein
LKSIYRFAESAYPLSSIDETSGRITVVIFRKISH